MRPRPDPDPVAPHDDPRIGDRLVKQRQVKVGDGVVGENGVDIEGFDELGSGSERRRIEVSRRSGEQKEEDQARKAVAEEQAD